MLTASRAKFSQHEELRMLLVSTGDAVLVEHTTNDDYWADGAGAGLNRVGHLLMLVRDELQNMTTLSHYVARSPLGFCGRWERAPSQSPPYAVGGRDDAHIRKAALDGV